MRFWDSSAIVPLLVNEAASARLAMIYSTDPEMVVWWGTEIECASALERRGRIQGGAAAEAMSRALRQLDQFTERWHEIGPTQQVRRLARRLLRRHSLRAADALQLAAALAARGDQPMSLEFVCVDDRLNTAARDEGLTILAPDTAMEPAARPYKVSQTRRPVSRQAVQSRVRRRTAKQGAA